jgi:hypothetical protein
LFYQSTIYQEANEMTQKWFKAINDRLAQVPAEDFGACMLPNPNGGPQFCEKMDQATCENLGGTFLGGDCGGAQVAEFLAKPKKK